jgi:hypothetical protein
LPTCVATKDPEIPFTITEQERTKPRKRDLSPVMCVDALESATLGSTSAALTKRIGGEEEPRRAEEALWIEGAGVWACGGAVRSVLLAPA